MRPRLRPALISLLALVAFTADAARLADRLIPAPQTATDAEGALPAAFTAVIDAPGLAPATPALRLLREHFAAGAPLPVTLRLDPAAGIAPEGYTLALTPARISLVAADAAGLFYGVQTLRQLAALHPAGIPAGTVADAPAFSLRGYMDDTGRNFRTVAEIKAQLDLFAAYKLNTYHWHLTDYPAWRVQCKAYPQLNDPKYRLTARDPNATYSYDDLREVIRYARERHIRVLPELDMPGHSTYFTNAFGFPMGDPRALPILEKLIEEFCAEIPKEDCPMLHLGSDEVHIKEPQQFIDAISAKTESLGRIPVLWNPGLKNNGRCISQMWGDQGSEQIRDNPALGVIDSSLGYLNATQPQHTVQRHFFLRACKAEKGDAKRLGAILCCWPDVRVEDKSLIAGQNGVWPGVVAFSENTWHGRPEYPVAYATELPPRGSAALAEFEAFERAVAVHRDLFFAGKEFPFSVSAHQVWRIAGPFLPPAAGAAPGFTPVAEIRENYTGADGKSVTWHTRTGGALLLDKTKGAASVHSTVPGACAYALTYVKAPTDGVYHARIGFEQPTRSNRQSTGIPPLGLWHAEGGAVLINDAPVPAPVWKQPGTMRFEKPTWEKPVNDVPYLGEEFYWTRTPTEIRLRAGWNKVLIQIPCRYFAADWGFSFLPVTRNAGGHWAEDTSLRFAERPE